jgi:putative peptidoglycan lipid II flippase
VLSRRLDGLDGGLVVRTAVRAVVAAALPAAAGGLVAHLARGAVGDGPAASLAALVAGGAVLALGYLLVARRMRLTELDEVLGPVLRRLPGGS